MNLEKPHIWCYARLDPAEIIGKKPRPLALSLYREIITDYRSENRLTMFKDVPISFDDNFKYPLLMSKLTSTLASKRFK